MKIAVCIKEVPDTATKIAISGDGKSVDFSNVKFVINPYDEFAVEEALKIKDQQSDTEVVAFSVGQARSTETIRKALAMGVDRAVFLQQDDLLLNEGFAVATLLSKMVESEQVDMLFLGKQSVDNDGYQVGAMIAGLLGWPQAMNVIELKIEAENALATREVEGGRREILKLKTPCVVGMTKGINEPRYPALKGIMAAKKKEIKTVSPADLGVDIDAVTSFDVSELSLPAERGDVQMIDGEPSVQAQELVKRLREEAKVI